MLQIMRIKAIPCQRSENPVQHIVYNIYLYEYTRFPKPPHKFMGYLASATTGLGPNYMHRDQVIAGR